MKTILKIIFATIVTILVLSIFMSALYIVIYLGVLTYNVHPALFIFYVLFVLGFLFNDDPYMDMPTHV